MLLQEAVSQDGHRGEADVVHRQIGCIIQGLGRAGVKGKIMVRRRRGLLPQTGQNAQHHTCTYITKAG